MLAALASSSTHSAYLRTHGSHPESLPLLMTLPVIESVNQLSENGSYVGYRLQWVPR